MAPGFQGYCLAEKNATQFPFVPKFRASKAELESRVRAPTQTFQNSRKYIAHCRGSEIGVQVLRDHQGR